MEVNTGGDVGFEEMEEGVTIFGVKIPYDPFTIEGVKRHHQSNPFEPKLCLTLCGRERTRTSVFCSPCLKEWRELSLSIRGSVDRKVLVMEEWVLERRLALVGDQEVLWAW